MLKLNHFLFICSSSLLLASLGTQAEESFSPYVDAKGHISLPKDFRLNMVHLGSWFVTEGDASGFHDVYTEEETVKAYRKTGKFPDGATLVKELRAADVHPVASSMFGLDKGVHSANPNVKQWFVMVKDSKGRFKGNKAWGSGWGWALVKTDAPTMNAVKDYKADCLGCHAPVKSTDWVYVEAYPTLQKTQ